jgi:hypothetical protein
MDMEGIEFPTKHVASTKHVQEFLERAHDPKLWVFIVKAPITSIYDDTRFCAKF